MRKVLFFLAALGLGTFSHATQRIAVTVGTGALQPNTTAGFNVSSGTVVDLKWAIAATTGTLTLTGATETWTNARFTGTAVNNSTVTYTGAQTISSATVTSFTANSGTFTIVNVGSGTISAFTATSGTFTFVATSGTGTFSGGFSAKGTSFSDSASAGFIGEYTSSDVTTAINFTTSNSYEDISTMSLTAGDWDVTGVAFATLNGATCTAWELAISPSGGNSTTGLVYGNNRWDTFPPTAAADSNIFMPVLRVSIATTTNYFLKARATYSAGTPKVSGFFSARRAR